MHHQIKEYQTLLDVMCMAIVNGFVCREFCINTVRPKQDGQDFSGDTFKRIFQTKIVF